MRDRPAVIFDMDGVLVNSLPAHCEAWARTAALEGLEFDRERFASLFGRISSDVIAGLWGEGRFTTAWRAAFDDRREAVYREIVRERFPAMPGATELIRSLAADGFALALASSGPCENAELVLDKLGVRSSFGALVTNRDVKRGKPDPEIFLTAAERLGVPPRFCAVVEDAPAGIAAANAAGMASIGLSVAAPSPSVLSAARLVVDALGQLSPLRIRRLLGFHGPRR